jgi:hypothetical protein
MAAFGNVSKRYAGYWGAVTWLEYRELVNCSLQADVNVQLRSR